MSSEENTKSENKNIMSEMRGVNRDTREGNGNPLQYSCLENATDGEAQ